MSSAVQPSTPSNTRFTLGDYIADVLLDKRHQANIYHWIVQRIGSPAIVMWGQEHSYENACVEARAYLKSICSAT